ITEPTTGRIRINGGVASLLEVGTGFHPELTGRENIYMNGAILGMKRAEIKRKFDEIVEFSGIEKFLDTPVKHYSSGMIVRLGFAVAAHLEPEVLVVDEVLAVGDAEFQKKCLGKMEDVVKNRSRTVLFVSHNMNAIQSFCSNAILLKQGKIVARGNPSEVINVYLNKELRNCFEQSWERFEEAPGNDEVRIKKVKLIPKSEGENHISIDTAFEVLCEIWNRINNASLNLSLHFYAITGELIFVAASEAVQANEGLISFKCYFPENFLNDSVYTISIMVVNNASPVYMYEQCLTFEVTDVPRGFGWQGKWPGMIRPKLNWQIIVHQEEEMK
ncbi:MAG: ABC transporter ATP-binding protein, partial [Nitrososphaerota archaeon]